MTSDKTLHLLQFTTVCAIGVAMMSQMKVYHLITDTTTTGACVNELKQQSDFNISFVWPFVVVMSAVHFALELLRTIQASNESKVPKALFTYGTGRVIGFLHLVTAAAHWIVYHILFKNQMDTGCAEHKSDIEYWAVAAGIAYSAAVLLQLIYTCQAYNLGDNDARGLERDRKQLKLCSRGSIGILVQATWACFMCVTIAIFYVRQLEPTNTCKAGGAISAVWVVCLAMAAVVIAFFAFNMTEAQNGKHGIFSYAFVVLWFLTGTILFILHTKGMECVVLNHNNSQDYVDDIRKVWEVAWLVGGVLALFALFFRKSRVVPVSGNNKGGLQVGNPQPRVDMQTLRLTTDGPDRRSSRLSFV